jgi:large repetitive protein
VVMGSAGEQRHAINVHLTGPAQRFERADTAQIRAGATTLVAVRLLDEWNVAVAQRPTLTVAATGVTLLTEDADSGSFGLQVRVNAEGVALIPVRAETAGPARIEVRAGRLESSFPLTVLPEIRSLLVMADGEIGVGAAPRSYGAILARGALDEHTSVTLSYDSRRANRGDPFGGAYDMLDEARYPTLGDRSQRTVLRGATTPLSMRVERERSWLLFGDMDTRGFGDARSPGHYSRALPGLSGELVDGPFSLAGFGTLVAQQLVQRQIRGDGSSGPYFTGGSVRLGTERVAIETRDAMNASLVLSRQEQERFVDYDIDAATGAILLRRPLPSSDAAGNPLMLVVLAEQLSGEESFVGGIRAAVDLARALNIRADSIGAGAAYIEDRSGLGGHTLFAADARVAMPWGGSRLDVARAAAGDSAGLAFAAAAWLGRERGTGVRLEWNRVGDGFNNPANPRLMAGTEDIRLSGNARLADAWSVTGSHQQQWFRGRGAERSRTEVGVDHQRRGARISLSAGMLEETGELAGRTSTSGSALAKAAYRGGPLSLWLEGTEPLSGNDLARPRTLGGGAAYELMKGIRLEGSHRIMSLDTASWSVSSAGLRTEFRTGTRAWTRYELSMAAGGYQSAALTGIGQKLKLGRGWGVDGMYERRMGLSRLPETDPLRALPFSQAEEERWSAAAGVEWARVGGGARAALRAELHDRAATGRGYRVFGTGEAALNRSWAMLLRQDAREDRRLLSTGSDVTRVNHSMAALAFRPTERSDWNALFKLERRQDRNPRGMGGALLPGTDERLIMATEAIWTPARGTELGARYALRFSEVSGELAGGASFRGEAHYVGGRLRQQVVQDLDVRVMARVLAESRSGFARWDVSPALGYTLLQGLDVEAGYRFGELRDRDFAPNGRKGWYVTLGMSLTERDGRRVTDFWRQRMEREAR